MSQHTNLTVTAQIESWPLQNPFVIARGSKTAAIVVVATITDENGISGRGECVPYARYNETPDAVLQTINDWVPHLDRNKLLKTLPAGAARNAIDCALWDYEARRNRTASPSLPATTPMKATETAFTLSLATPEDMARAARHAADKTLLKLKLGGGDGHDRHRMHAVRDARPDARLIGDANEGWKLDELEDLLHAAHEFRFELIEQPLPVDADEALRHMTRPISVCADESHHTTEDLPALVGKYDAVNIKLDKAGGLTEAYRIANVARQNKFDIMIGSMVATSLAVAPAYQLASLARWVDLDGPLLIKQDRPGGFHFDGSRMLPATPGFWGS